MVSVWLPFAVAFAAVPASLTRVKLELGLPIVIAPTKEPAGIPVPVTRS
jgi:hypothetical protein